MIRRACPAGDQYLTWDDFTALGRERYAAEPGEIAARVAAIKPGDPVALLYTSGTTGNPKGVLLTHRNILYAIAAADRGPGHPACPVGLLPAAGAHRGAHVQHLRCRSASSATSTSAPTRRGWCG